MQALQENTTLQGGKYRIISVLGQGGFGITYLAEQVMLGRKVAVKEFFMKDLCNRDEDTCHVSVGSMGSGEMVARFKEKFLKEARLIAGMDNNHIVRIYDIFEENGTAYYIMENIDGGSVDGLVKGGALEERRALAIIREVADALQYIHQQNVLHLDVKPSNLLFRKSGGLVLIDFGISKRYDVEGGQTSTTPVGISKGFAPIEQYNQGLQNFSPATDVYSLGATFYKLLTGKTPPEAPVLLDDEDFPECPSNVTKDIWRVIEKAMEPRRKRRFQSVEVFMKALKFENIGKEMDIVPFEETQIVVPQHQVADSTTENETTVLITDAMIQGSQIETEDAVDLGLSVKWCSHNLGAYLPHEYGSYFSWGMDCATGNTLDWNALDEEIAGTQSDVAYIMKRGRWRTPTRKQFKELIDKCKWTWFEYKGVWGYKITGVTGKSIFLPAAGKLNNAILFRGYYWSSSKSHVYNTAHYLYFNSEDFNLEYEPINVQRTIRPVYE